MLVDDGSRDATAAVADAFAAADGRIRVLRRPRLGLVAALEAGLAECGAPWIARMDADDVMHRDRLAAQLHHLEARPDLDGAGCHVRVFPRADLRPGRRRYEAWLNGLRDADDVARNRFVECPLAHPTWIVRRSLLERFGYRDCGWPEDYDLALRLLARGHRLGVVPRRLVCWRDRPDRLSRRHPAYGLERFVACKAAHLAEDFLGPHADYVLWGYGGTGRALRRALAALGRRPTHIVEIHPRRLGQRIHGAPVVAPEALLHLPRRPLVASVAGSAARDRIRKALADMGFREMSDFVCAA